MRCPGCTLVFADPLTVQDPVELYEAAYRGEVDAAGMQQYRERLVAQDGGVEHVGDGLWTPAFAAGLDWLRAELGARAGVLELGSARGYALHAARERGLDPVGLDVAATVVDRSRAQGFRVHHGTLDSLPEDFVQAAGVMSFFVLHHLPDPLGWLRQVRTRFPEALLVVAVHGHDEGRPLSQYTAPPRTLTRWSTPALQRLFAEAGYTAQVLPCRGGPSQAVGRLGGAGALLRRAPAAYRLARRALDLLPRSVTQEAPGAVLLVLARPAA